MDAFKSAVISKESAQNKGVNQITSGIKDAVVAIGGGVAFGGGVGGSVGMALKHTLAGKVGGVGGNLMLASIQGKKDTDKFIDSNKNMIAEFKASYAKMTPTERLKEEQGLVDKVDSIMDVAVEENSPVSKELKLSKSLLKDDEQDDLEALDMTKEELEKEIEDLSQTYKKEKK